MSIITAYDILLSCCESGRTSEAVQIWKPQPDRRTPEQEARARTVPHPYHCQVSSLSGSVFPRPYLSVPYSHSTNLTSTWATPNLTLLARGVSAVAPQGGIASRAARPRRGVTETKEPFCLGRAPRCAKRLATKQGTHPESQLLCPPSPRGGRSCSSCCCCSPAAPARSTPPAPTSARRMDMAPASVYFNPRSVEEIFKDFSGRRAGLVRALTSGNDRSPLAAALLRPAQI
jgi:hypothetical protein